MRNVRKRNSKMNMHESIVPTIKRSEKMKKFNERRVYDASCIDNIVINTSLVDVNIKPSTSSDIEIHLIGKAIGDVHLNSIVQDTTLNISVTVLGSLYNEDLKINLLLPKKSFQLKSTT